MLNRFLLALFNIRLLKNREQTGTALRINNLIKLTGNKKYLEIGVNHGYTFEGVNVELKVGVDPSRKVITINTGKFLKMTSDDFFLSNTLKFDMVFIDGLHEYQQVIRDIFNSLHCLEPGGFLLVDDVVPSKNLEASLEWGELTKIQKKFIERGDFSWQGDVYKAIFLLTNSFRESLNFATIIDDQHYQIVIWKKDYQTDIEFPSKFLLDKFNDKKFKSNLLAGIPVEWNPIQFNKLLYLLSNK